MFHAASNQWSCTFKHAQSVNPRGRRLREFLRCVWRSCGGVEGAAFQTLWPQWKRQKQPLITSYKDSALFWCYREKLLIVPFDAHEDDSLPLWHSGMLGAAPSYGLITLCIISCIKISNDDGNFIIIIIILLLMLKSCFFMALDLMSKTSPLNPTHNILIRGNMREWATMVDLNSQHPCETRFLPPAAAARRLNVFWQRKHYHSSRHPSAARSWGTPP